MIIQRKTQIILALIISSVFLFQNCTTLIRGTSQKIPVTSSPSGAKITVDGEEVGYAPLNLKLKRKKSHIIRVEKQGYNPLEIRVTRKTSTVTSILGNVIWGGISATSGGLVWLGMHYGRDVGEEWFWALTIGGGILGWGGATLTDLLSGANYTLSPKELNVKLEKIERKSQSNFILIDAEQFKNIKWIRIKCADSDGEEIVNID